MTHVDCTVYDSIASLVSFAFANPNPRSSVEMKVFSPRYLQALQQVVNASRHHLCCLARTTIQLAHDKCRRMASYDVIRGQEIEGTSPSCKGPFGQGEMRQIHTKSCLKPESEKLVWNIHHRTSVCHLKASRLAQLCFKHAVLQDVWHTWLFGNRFVTHGWCESFEW